MKDIKIYIVGGYVRDKIMGIPSRDCDYCVVGATPEDMLDKGFKQVGADFPVFLDDSGEEYALARTERKNGKGYHGFDVDYNPDVTIEDDLQRRDLTINAIALGSSGEYIDPYNGIDDINNKLLRHVSDSFKEDPLRVLRVARFAAKFPDFSVHEETMDMMRELVNNNEIDELVPERVSLETIKALKEKQPSNYFKVLHEVGALERIMPEIAVLDGVPQPLEHHPEGDSFLHTMMVLDEATKLTDDPVARFAALVHDLGKGVTPKEEWPRHINHEKNGVPLVTKMCERLKFPTEYKKTGELTSEYHLKIHRSYDLTHKSMHKLFEAFSLNQQGKREIFDKVLIASEADAKGRKGLENKPYPQREYLKGLADTWSSIKMRDIMEKQGMSKMEKDDIPKMKELLDREKKMAMKKQMPKYNKGLDISL